MPVPKIDYAVGIQSKIGFYSFYSMLWNPRVIMCHFNTIDTNPKLAVVMGRTGFCDMYMNRLITLIGIYEDGIVKKI
jgi:hypothetical protein